MPCRSRANGSPQCWEHYHRARLFGLAVAVAVAVAGEGLPRVRRRVELPLAWPHGMARARLRQTGTCALTDRDLCLLAVHQAALSCLSARRRLFGGCTLGLVLPLLHGKAPSRARLARTTPLHPLPPVAVGVARYPMPACPRADAARRWAGGALRKQPQIAGVPAGHPARRPKVVYALLALGDHGGAAGWDCRPGFCKIHGQVYIQPNSSWRLPCLCLCLPIITVPFPHLPVERAPVGSRSNNPSARCLCPGSLPSALPARPPTAPDPAPAPLLRAPPTLSSLACHCPPRILIPPRGCALLLLQSSRIPLAWHVFVQKQNGRLVRQEFDRSQSVIAKRRRRAAAPTISLALLHSFPPIQVLELHHFPIGLPTHTPPRPQRFLRLGHHADTLAHYSRFCF